jgi:hypothetical protein
MAFPLADERESLVNLTEYLWRKKAGRRDDSDSHICINAADGTPMPISSCDYFSRTSQLRTVPAPSLKANQPRRGSCPLLNHPNAADIPMNLVS